MRPSLLPLILLFGACAPQYVGPASGKARFSEFPQPLFQAFRDSCVGPTRRFSEPGPNTAECQELMPPTITAAFILEYDGLPQDLPRLVIRFEAQEDAQSYVVSNDIYVSIPQKNGAPRQVPYQDVRLRRELDRLYLNAGGVPEP